MNTENLEHLLAKNRTWADRIREQDPEFFHKLSQQQFPEYLWIGCSDSRVPANQIVGLLPGELFVRRNIANLVVHTEFELFVGDAVRGRCAGTTGAAVSRRRCGGSGSA